MVRIDRDLFDLIKEAAKNDRRTFKETMSQVLRKHFERKLHD